MMFAIAAIALALILVLALDRYVMGDADIGAFWLLLLIGLGGAVLYLVIDMVRSGSFFYDDVNYRWRLRRSKSPVTFWIVCSLFSLFGAALIALPIAFVLLAG